jgi:hypothetical protein
MTAQAPVNPGTSGVRGQPVLTSVSMNLIMRHYVLIVSRSGS